MKSRHSSHRRGQRGGASDEGVSVMNIVVLVCMVVVLVLIYYYIYNDNQMQQQQQHVESFTDGKIDLKDNEVALVLFYADWCPHCIKFKPTWSKMSNSLDESKTRGGKRVRMMNFDCDKEPNKPLANKYGIDGYPTIKVITMENGKESVEDYDGERTEAAIKQFVDSL